MLLPDGLQGLIARLVRGGGRLADLVPPDIEDNAAAHSIGESEICRLIREETDRTQECLPMVVGPLEGAFLTVMARTVCARRVLKIGTFTGSSAITMAEAFIIEHHNETPKSLEQIRDGLKDEGQAAASDPARLGQALAALVEKRLLYEEKGKYFTLALPMNPNL